MIKFFIGRSVKLVFIMLPQITFYRFIQSADQVVIEPQPSISVVTIGWTSVGLNRALYFALCSLYYYWTRVVHINFFRLSLFENLTILCINKKPKPFSNKRALKKFKKKHLWPVKNHVISYFSLPHFFIIDKA